MADMKKKLGLLFVMLALFAGFIGVKFFFLDKQSTDGVLKVLSSPTTSIFINNNAIGKTPYEDKLKEGEYLLKLIPEGTATETASWQGKILISRNALTFVDRELGTSDLSSAGVIFNVTKMTTKPQSGDQGEISVESDPDGAIVSLDNDEKGIAPLVLSNIPKGDHELSVSTPGFFRRSQKVNVEAGFRINAQFKLAQDPAFKKVEEPSPQASISATPAPTGAKVTVTPKVTPTGKVTPTPTGSKSGSVGSTIVIADTPTGWLRVRTEPSVNASESAKVNPGESYKVLEEQSGWYKINYKGTSSGWISAQYTKVSQ